jgi:hypothetical protein
VDFPATASAVEKSQRLEKMNPVGDGDCDLSALLELL